jgi:Ca2+-binding RTX toxin-like protein
MIDPLAAYQFSFAIPTLNQDATLTFEIDVAALSPQEQSDFLAALAAGNATVAVKNDAPGSVYQAFAVCGPGETPAEGCVAITRLDADGNPLPEGSTETPAFVRFESVTGHFSTFAVVLVTPAAVENSPPEIISLASSAATVGSAAEGQAVTIAADFADPDAGDSHTAVIDWGDGTQTPGTVNGLSVAGSHAYAVGGVYTITVNVSDAEPASDVATTTAFVTGAGVRNGVLQVVGTTNNDVVVVTTQGANTVRVFAGFLPGSSFRDFAAAGITSTHVLLGDGNDAATIAGGLSLPALLDGGNGNDALLGGKATNILLGGDGVDLLTGGQGRDLLIGGRGSDVMLGLGGEDLLIAGTTAFDANAAALWAIHQEWNSNRSYATRVANLRDGSGSADRANGSYFLQATRPDATVFDDGAIDLLVGGGGRDWFFANLDGSALDYFLWLDDDEFTDDLD